MKIKPIVGKSISIEQIPNFNVFPMMLMLTIARDAIRKSLNSIKVSMGYNLKSTINTFELTK